MTASHQPSVPHRPGVRLATDPAEHPGAFAVAFNSGDPDLLDQVYEPDAVFVPPSGVPVTGEDRRRANTEFQGLGLPITVCPRHVWTSGDTALLIVDWTIDGTGPDGTPAHLAGTATDVARRGSDGRWRYVIDNPFGVAVRDGSGKP